MSEIKKKTILFDARNTFEKQNVFKILTLVINLYYIKLTEYFIHSYLKLFSVVCLNLPAVLLYPSLPCR